MRRLLTLAVCCATLAVGLAGCREAATFDLLLVHDVGLSPTRDLLNGRIRVYDLGDEATGVAPSLLFEHSGSAAELIEGVELDVLRGLTEEHKYIAFLSFDTPAGCGGSARVVGRSLPFVHQSEPYSVSVQIGCADRFSPTRGAPMTGRLGFGASATPDGNVLVAGGTATLDLDLAAYVGAVTSVERYDLHTGRFSEVGIQSTARVAPATVTLANGEVAMLGGFTPEPIACLASTEVVWPAPRATADLGVPRCAPSAVRVADDNVLVVGGEADGIVALELHDATLDERLVSAALPSAVMRSAPRLIAAGEVAIAVGGDGFGQPRVEIVNPTCATTTQPCGFPIAIAAADDPGEGWVNTTGELALCVEGSEVTTGALYVMGGAIRSAPGVEPTVGVDGVFCAVLTADPFAWELRRIGSLPAPRAGAQMVRVAGAGDRQRLLLIGGNDPGSGEVWSDALFMEVRGCTCGIVSTTTVSLPNRPSLLLHQAVVLPDASVLVLGGVRFDLARNVLSGATYSALFFPATEVD